VAGYGRTLPVQRPENGVPSINSLSHFLCRTLAKISQRSAMRQTGLDFWLCKAVAAAKTIGEAREFTVSLSSVSSR